MSNDESLAEDLFDVANSAMKSLGIGGVYVQVLQEIWPVIRKILANQFENISDLQIFDDLQTTFNNLKEKVSGGDDDKWRTTQIIIFCVLSSALTARNR